MKCPLCGGKMKKEEIDYEKHWGEKIYGFKKVPAFICESCGDILIPADAAKAMEEIIKKQEKPEEYI
jgi:YgiT-type zinc finger domain-containing protein